MAGDINITMTAQDKDVQKAYSRLQKENIKLKRDLEKAGDAGERSGRRTASGFDKAKQSGAQLGKQLGLVVGGTELAVAAAGKLKDMFARIADESERLNRSIDSTAKKQAELELKLQIQAGLTPQQVRNKLPTIKNTLLQTPSVNFSDAIQIETQLASSGFSQKDIDSGAALKTIADLKAATNQFGETVDDPTGAVKAIAQYKKATGSATPSAAEVRATGGKLTQLFKGSDIQFGDLTNLAKVASGLTAAGLDESTQFGAFSLLRDVEAPGEAATHLRNVVANLQSAGTSKVKTEALGKLGLKPGDVDLVGESFPEALARFNNRLQGLKPEDANNVLFQLFEKEGAASARVLLGNLGKLDERIQLQENPEAFEDNVRAFQKSRFARGERDKIEEDFALRNRDIQSGEVGFDEVRQRLRTLRAKGEIGPLRKVGGDAALEVTERLPGDFRPTDISRPSAVQKGAANAFVQSLFPAGTGGATSAGVEAVSQILGFVGDMVKELKDSNQTQKQVLAEQKNANNRGKRPRVPKAGELNRN